MKKILSLLVTVYLLVSPDSVLAVFEPRDFANNKYGIHISDESDLLDAASLVNGTNGKWGYVTFVIREDERDHDRWQKFFDQLRQLKLIPIVRIATKIENSNWTRPSLPEATNWADFLNSLAWPVYNRYVVIFNEPNHAKEWGGDIDPQENAQVLKTYSLTLKNASENFFILPAALDSSASDTDDTMSFSRFISELVVYDKTMFEFIDGWNSHSYPNPHFSGKATDMGLGTITSWEQEIEILSNYGLNPDIPVFITETGWSTTANSESDITANFLTAFTKVWIKKNIVAITPFILDYVQEPLNVFSFKDPVTGNYFKFFDVISTLPKIEGRPLEDTNIFDQLNNLKEDTVAKSVDIITAILQETTIDHIAQN